MACLWMGNEDTLESRYTRMREDEVTALRRVNAELREKVERLEEELWNTRIVQHQSVQRAPELGKCSRTLASKLV